jgi:hypothetical protein
MPETPKGVILRTLEFDIVQITRNVHFKQPLQDKEKPKVSKKIKPY